MLSRTVCLSWHILTELWQNLKIKKCSKFNFLAIFNLYHSSDQLWLTVSSLCSVWFANTQLTASVKHRVHSGRLLGPSTPFNHDGLKGRTQTNRAISSMSTEGAGQRDVSDAVRVAVHLVTAQPRPPLPHFPQAPCGAILVSRRMRS